MEAFYSLSQSFKALQDCFAIKRLPFRINRPEQPSEKHEYEHFARKDIF